MFFGDNLNMFLEFCQLSWCGVASFNHKASIIKISSWKREKERKNSSVCANSTAWLLNVCLPNKRTPHLAPFISAYLKVKVSCCHGVDRLFREKTTPDHEMTWFWPGRCFGHAIIWNAYRQGERWKCFVGCFPPVFCRLKQFIFHFGSIPEETNSRWVFLQDVRPLKFSFFFPAQHPSSTVG